MTVAISEDKLKYNMMMNHDSMKCLTRYLVLEHRHKKNSIIIFLEKKHLKLGSET